MKCFVTQTETIVIKNIQAIKKFDSLEMDGKKRIKIYWLQIELNGGTTYKKAYKDKSIRDYDYEAIKYDLTDLIKD